VEALAIKFDFTFALAVWLLSLLIALALPVEYGLVVVATTFNLWHQRNTTYNAGTEFTRRVHDAVSERLSEFDARIKKFEQVASDVRESQIKIAGQFGGRTRV
jgi:hypothetical protein